MTYAKILRIGYANLKNPLNMQVHVKKIDLVILAAIGPNFIFITALAQLRP